MDTYGGRCAHGGGAFSGKDCTKVDRSAAYFCRYIAKNMVAAGLADEVEIQVAYAIGVTNPLSVFVDSFGTGKFTDDKLAEIIKKEFDLRPYAIIRALGLRRPLYSETSAYGHFGRRTSLGNRPTAPPRLKNIFETPLRRFDKRLLGYLTLPKSKNGGNAVFLVDICKPL